jgi:hypothetical protein
MRGVGWLRWEIYRLSFWTNLSPWTWLIFDKLDRDFTKAGSGGLFGFNYGLVE